jgi:hypothetical protein
MIRFRVAVFAVLVTACSSNDDVVRPQPTDPEIAALVLPRQALEADGATTLRIAAALTPGSDATDRYVIFTTTAGEFQRPGESNAASVRVAASVSDTAVVLLRAPATPALAVIRASIGGSVRQDTLRFVVATGGVTGLTFSARTGTADGVSPIVVTATVPATASGTDRAVAFSTTIGTLTAGTTTANTVTVTADASGMASALLRASGAGLGLVTASTGRGTRQDTVTFVAARPETVELEPAQFTVKGDLSSTVDLTAYLRRRTGSVTPGATVRFSAVRAEGPGSGTSIGIFSVPTPSDTGGRVTARFAPADSVYRGRVTITAQTLGASGDTLQAQTVVTVVP